MEHKNITGADVHEPKGVETASAGTAYIANGAGSGTWQDPKTGLNNSNRIALTTRIDNISAAPSSAWVVSPIAGKIVGIAVVLYNGITVANATITAKLNGVTVGGSSITVTQAGSGAGSVFSSSPSTSNSVTANGAIEIHSDGASTTTCQAEVTVWINTA